MAKFTKLNIGDIVASSGGRVWKKLSAEGGVTLEGTWVIKSISDFEKPSSTLYWDVNGTFNCLTSTDVYATAPLKCFYVSNTSYMGWAMRSYIWGINGSEGGYPIYLNESLVSSNSVRSSYVPNSSSSSVWTYSTNPLSFTMTITDTVDDVTDGDTLLTWLKANATKTA